jgi:hypothetical protein
MQEKKNASAAEAGEIRIATRSTNDRRASGTPTPKATPIAEPAAPRISASSRNCRRMSCRRAPTESRSPISRVRCSTDASWMFRCPRPDHHRDRRGDHERDDQAERDPPREANHDGMLSTR